MSESLFDQKDDRDYLAELTAPGGKFDKSKYPSEIEMYKAIAKGKVLADETISFKDMTTDQLREDYLRVMEENKTKAKLDDYLNRLENVKTDGTSTNVTQEVTKPQIDEAEFDKKLMTKLQQIEAQKKESENLAIVDKRLRESLGDNAQSILKEKMNALNLSTEDLKLLARKSPDAVINALGLNRQPGNYQNLPSSNIRSDNFKPNVEIRDAVYWEKLRRENPKEYFSEKSSILRLKDMSDPNFMSRYNAG